jgi:hypothetical protein
MRGLKFSHNLWEFFANQANTCVNFHNCSTWNNFVAWNTLRLPRKAPVKTVQSPKNVPRGTF